MSLRPSLPYLFACALFGLVVALLSVDDPQSAGFYRFEVSLQSDQPGFAQLYWDDGHGYDETKSVRQPVPVGRDVRLIFPLPLGQITALRLDPIDRPARLTVERARIVTRKGDNIRTVRARAFRALHQVATLEATGERLQVVTTSDADDPSLGLVLLDPLILPERSAGPQPVARAAIVFAFLIGVGACVSISRMRGFVAGGVDVIRHGSARRPLTTIIAAGALAALVSCTLPLLRGHDLGTGATLATPRPSFGWVHSLDPLNLLVLFTGDDAWWKLRAVLARAVFASGTGFVVWRLTRHLPSALLIAASAPFTGLFARPLDPFATFGMGYAPWILGCALGASEANRALPGMLWGAGWLLSNAFLLSSGSPTMATVALGLNAVAVVAALLASAPPWRTRLLRATAFASVGTLLLVFVVSTSLTDQAALPPPASEPLAPAAVHQVPPTLVAGLFDAGFQRAFHGGEAINPAANFLILFGLAWLIIRAREAWRERTIRALIIGFVATALALLGVVPPSRLAALPAVTHFPAFDFNAATLFLVLALTLAGWGWREAWTRLARREGLAEGVAVTGLVAAVLAAYYGTAHAILRSLEVELAWGIWIGIESWVHLHAVSLLVAGAGLMALVAIAVRRNLWTPSMIVYCATCFYLLHWRYAG